MKRFRVDQSFLNMIKIAVPKGEGFRPALTYVHLNKEQLRAEATDGQTLRTIDMPELSGLEANTLIMFNHVKLKRKEAAFIELDKNRIAIIEINSPSFTDEDLTDEQFDSLIVEVKHLVVCRDKLTYPVIDQVISSKQKVFRASFNVDLLLNLVNSANSSRIVLLEFQESGVEPISVSINDISGTNVIMPARFFNKSGEPKPCGLVNAAPKPEGVTA